ncbi:hypothetical protein BLNAU_24955 [Blattamonas nauphoetae]|uniref:Uncharacterized protein n=1 Tax=Blattamonas nauphoetae TaxID=2049346 RepID=A0ABQ9WKZ0_9EUKA|nr:hypothetical protein BLNAU_24955 [Blattamonas nauphoetae]
MDALRCPFDVRREMRNHRSLFELFAHTVDHQLLAPLVDVYYPAYPHQDTSLGNCNDFTNQESVGVVSVTSSSSSLRTVHLPHGTGPLFDFGSLSSHPRLRSSLSINTHLIHSRLVNVSSLTSSCLFGNDLNQQSQQIVGVEVSECSNNLYGTTCRDINDGGSVLFQNSSFSRCSTNLEPSSTHPNYTLQHRSGEEQKFFFDWSFDSTSITFTRCSFHTVTSSEGGGAIGLQYVSAPSPSANVHSSTVGAQAKTKEGSCVCVYYTDGQASVSILSCFFSNCTADDHGGTLRLYFGHTQTVSNCVFLSFGNDASYGGIIYCENQKTEVHVSHNFFSDGNGSFGGAVLLKRPKGPASISFCVFRNCHGSFGCSCHVDDTSNSVSISHCDFLECTGSYGGGLYFDDCSSLVTVTDSSFEKCNASTGGAIFINNTASFKLDSLQFASCTSNKGKDVCFFTQSKADVDGTDMIVNCTSSSGNNNVYFGGDNSNDSDLIPQAPAVSLTPISVSASLTLEGDEWVLTVSTSEPIEGTLLVVLDNKPAEESNYEQPTSRSPPPIGRLFVLDFGSGETSKSQSVPINEWSFLQYESNYSITVASLAGANITQSFSSILVTPNPSRIVEATCEIKDGDPTTGIISLRGRTLEEGHYMAQLKEVGDLPISVTFTESHTLPNSKTMISSTIEVSLLGEEMKLEYGKNPTRLTGAGTGEYRNDKDPSIVSIPLTGTEIPIGSYEMNVSLVEDGSSEEITLNVTFSSKERDSNSSLRGPDTAILFDGSTEISSKNSISVPDSTHARVTFAAEWTTSPSTVAYVIVNVPKAPCVTEISCVINDSLTHFVVKFTGQNLPLSGTYTARLTIPFNFSVTFKDGVGTSGLIEGMERTVFLWEIVHSPMSPGPTLSDVMCSLDSSDFAFVDLTLTGSEMPSSTEYKLIIVEAGKYTQMIVPVSFNSQTDGKGELKLDKPIVIHNDGQSTLSIALTGTEIPVGSYEMNVSLVEDGSSEEITLNVSFSSKESGTATAVVFDAENGKVDLLFDSEYSIVSLWNEKGSVWIPSHLSFFVPSNPGIVETVDSTSLNDAKMIVTLAFCGSDFVSGPTHIVLLDGSNEVTSFGNMSVISSTRFTVSVAAGWTQSPSTVAYGQTYSLKSVSSSSSSFLVQPSISVKIPKAPCVTEINCDIDTSLTHFVVKFTGQDLPLSGTYTARLMSSSTSFEVTLSERVGKNGLIEGNATNGLLFGTEYTLSSLSQGTDQILLNATSFSTPTGPTLSDVTCSLDSSDFNFVDLTLSGSGMPSSTEYKLIVADSEDSTQLALDVSFTSSSEGSGSVEVYHKEHTLKYGLTYSVVSLTLHSLSISLPSQSITFDVPNPPRLTAVDEPILVHNDGQSTLSIALTGTEIPVGSYEMNVSLVEDGSSEEITLNVSFSSKESGTATAVVFDAENGKVDLLFDSEYSIDSLWKIDASIWIPSSLSFVVPSSPGIVESIDSALLNDAKTIVTLTFYGSDFVSGPTHVVLLDGSNEVMSNEDLYVRNEIHFTVTFAAGWTQSPSTVAYDQTYSLKSVSSSSSSFIVRPSISVTIPKAPCVTRIECDIDTSLVHFVVKLSGSGLPRWGTCTARLAESLFSFSVTFTNEVGWSDPIEGNASNGLLFGTEYTLSSLSQGTDQILLNATSFSTPTGPTLSDVTCSLDSSDFNFVDLTLSGSGMPSSTEYKLIVADSEDSTQLALDVSFTSSSEGIHHFDVPNPPRLTAVDEPILVHNDGQSTLSIALTGTEIPVGSYEMNVSLVEDGSSEEITLNVSFSSKESGTATAVVFDAENGKVDLLFDSEYSIVSLWNEKGSVWIPSHLSFFVPSNPGIVETVDSTSLNDAKMIVTLAFCGSDFVSGPTHIVLLDGSNEVTSFGNMSVISSTRFTVSVAAGWTQSPSTVAYGQTYSLKSVSSSSSSFLVQPSISVKIPKAPCVTEINCDIDTSLTHFVVKFTGQDLPLSGTYTARLMSSSTSFEVTLSERVGKTG